ncbi:hypothetical protein [Planctomycetes bacterium K23_9]|uniref:Uncharacterized protein n=1 Tax=Stieleria marina TaxID=1930275 RepID=A0A517NTH5_9BACT|nr:hypothetical protein K239x_23790 [Planctomycetes bacterium K23_9]
MASLLGLESVDLYLDRGESTSLPVRWQVRFDKLQRVRAMQSFGEHLTARTGRLADDSIRNHQATSASIAEYPRAPRRQSLS